MERNGNDAPSARTTGSGRNGLNARVRRAALAMTVALAALPGLETALTEPVEPTATETTAFAGRAYTVVGDLWQDADGGWWRPVVVTTTAYAPTREQCDDSPGETATGSDAFATYGIAADPRALPYGTVLRIPGYGEARVDDTGGDMRRAFDRGVIHLDLRIPLRRADGRWRSEDEATRVALRHGRRKDRTVLVKVVMPVTAAVPGGDRDQQ